MIRMNDRSFGNVAAALIIVLADEQALAQQNPNIKPRIETEYSIGANSTHVISKEGEEARFSEKAGGIEVFVRVMDRLKAGGKIDAYTFKLYEFGYSGKASQAAHATESIKSSTALRFGPSAELELLDSEVYDLRVMGHILFSPRTGAFETYAENIREQLFRLGVEYVARREIKYNSGSASAAASRKINGLFSLEAGIERDFSRITARTEGFGDVRQFAENKTKFRSVLEISLPQDLGRIRITGAYGGSGTKGFGINYSKK